jgi:hypothetical protein
MSKKTEKEVMSFEELIDVCTRVAFDRFLLEGGKGLRGAMHQIYQIMFTWQRDKDKK